MNNKNVFAENLKYYMKINNKTRKQVCNDLGISYYTFSDWVNGKKYPRMDKVELLANYFKILKSDLIEDKENNTSNILTIEGLGKKLHISELQTENALSVEMIPKYIKRLERMREAIGVNELNDEEFEKLLEYAKLLISARKAEK